MLGCFTTPTISLAQEFPSVGKLVVIESRKTIDSLGDGDNTTIPLKVRKYLKEVATANNIGVVISEAAYVTAENDVTTEFIKGYKSKTPAKELSLPAVKINPRVALVNSEKVFSDPELSKDMIRILISEFKSRQDALRVEAKDLKAAAVKFDAEAQSMSADVRLAQQQAFIKQDKALQIKQKEFTEQLNVSTGHERLKIAEAIIPIIKKLAIYQGLDFVIQASAYTNPQYDMTEDLIALANKQKSLSEIKKREVLSNPFKLATINGDKIFSTFLDRPQGDVITAANIAIKEFAIKNNIGMVIQASTYTDPRLEVTEQIINSMKVK
jgi:outer membrane protein